MDTQNFKHTFSALEDLSQSLITLKEAFKIRKNAALQQKEAYRDNMADKNKQIDVYKQTLNVACEKIDEFAKTIDMVLSENGSGNNSN